MGLLLEDFFFNFQLGRLETHCTRDRLEWCRKLVRRWSLEGNIKVTAIKQCRQSPRDK